MIGEEKRWKLRKTAFGVLGSSSVSLKLRREKKITPEFEAMLSTLPLEDLIALKLEQSAKLLHTTNIGVPLWLSLVHICKDAALKYAYSISKSRLEAGHAIGVMPYLFKRLLYQYRIEYYFKDLMTDKRKEKIVDTTTKIVDSTYQK